MNVFVPTPDSYNWIEFNLCALLAGPVCEPTATDTYSPPIATSTSSMVPGIAWGSAGVIESPVSVKSSYYTYTHELLAIEDVTVGETNFTECLKIHKLHIFDVSRSRVDWFCPDMGLVKRIDGGNSMMELREVIFEQ